MLLAAAVLGACNAPQYQTTKQSDINRLTKSASFKMPKVPVPEFPDRTFNGNGDWWRPIKKGKMAPTQWKKHLKEKGGIVAKDIWYPDSASLLAHSYCLDQNVPVITDDSLWQVVKSFLRPVLLHFVGCKNILLEGVTFENSPRQLKTSKSTNRSSCRHYVISS